MDEPDIGYYVSGSNNTLAWQLSEMKDAGISWILVSWWGTGNKTQPKADWKVYSAINNATLNLFKYLAANKATYSFKVAIMVENFNGSLVNGKKETYDMTPSDFAHVYGYIYTHFYNPFNSIVFYWVGKPLITTFNGWMGLPQNDTFTYRVIGSPPNNYNWNFWQGDGYLTAAVPSAQPWNYEHSPQISNDGEVGLIWRYDDYYQRPNSYMRFDPNGTLGLYDYEWGFAVSNAKQINLVLLYSWNEYHERSELEPHKDLTAVNSSEIGVTAQFVSELESAKSSLSTPTRWPNVSQAFVLLDYVLSFVLVALVGFVIVTRWKRARHRALKPSSDSFKTYAR